MTVTDLALSSTFAESVGRGVGAISAYCLLGLVLLIAGFYAIDLATPGKLAEVIREDRNPNAALIASSGVLAVALIVAASILTSDSLLLEGLIATTAFGITGIVGQVVATVVFDKVLGFNLAHLINDPNPHPAAKLVASTHLAIGLVTAIAVI